MGGLHSEARRICRRLHVAFMGLRKLNETLPEFGSSWVQRVQVGPDVEARLASVDVKSTYKVDPAVIYLSVWSVFLIPFP